MFETYIIQASEGESLHCRYSSQLKATDVKVKANQPGGSTMKSLIEFRCVWRGTGTASNITGVETICVFHLTQCENLELLGEILTS